MEKKLSYLLAATGRSLSMREGQSSLDLVLLGAKFSCQLVPRIAGAHSRWPIKALLKPLNQVLWCRRRYFISAALSACAAERRRLAAEYIELLLAQGPTAEQHEEHIRRMYELCTPIGPEVRYNLMFSMPAADVLHISACCQYASTQML